nr:hypothetical protein Itr_chr14CG23250 [Ipomoea trifida]
MIKNIRKSTQGSVHHTKQRESNAKVQREVCNIVSHRTELTHLNRAIVVLYIVRV